LVTSLVKVIIVKSFGQVKGKKKNFKAAEETIPASLGQGRILVSINKHPRNRGFQPQKPSFWIPKINRIRDFGIRKRQTSVLILD
jgi:hypothetical protein